jgi:hypothetical protein
MNPHISSKDYLTTDMARVSNGNIKLERTFPPNYHVEPPHGKREAKLFIVHIP